MCIRDRGKPKRGRGARADAPQLGLFAPASQDTATPAVRGVVERLRAVDPNALTPMEALLLVAQLKQELGA